MEEIESFQFSFHFSRVKTSKGLSADLSLLRNPVLMKPYATVELIRCFAQCFLFSGVTWEASLALKFARVYAQKR